MQSTMQKIFWFFVLVLNSNSLSISESQRAKLQAKDEDGRKLLNFLQTPSNAHSTPPDKTDPEKDVYFYLYTRKMDVAYQFHTGNLSELNASSFDPAKPTKVAIHGYAKSYLSEAVQLIRQAYLNKTDVNIIGVDWSVLAKHPWYFWAANNTYAVGKQVGRMVDWLVSTGARLEDFHLIGHSLGAHVAGFAANHVTSGNITRITGLDPALPMFGLPNKPPSKRLDPTDANIVDCIHTCGDFLGFYQPLGTHDFYPNSGKFPQPGCSFDVLGHCSHLRSILLYAESVNSTFKATCCTSMDELKDENCSNGLFALMGDPAAHWHGGIYFLKTNPEYPFSIG